MRIKSPCIITPRLLPGVKVGDAILSIEQTDNITPDDRDIYRYYLDTPEFEYTAADLFSGVGGHAGLQAMLASCLGFLAACAESGQFELRTGRTRENTDLFPSHVGEWAMTQSDELGILAVELKETENLIVEED